LPFCLALSLLVPFAGFYLFPSSGFGSSSCASWDLRFKLCAFVVNELIKGEIEKLNGQFLGLIVMSH
jgi:hypothetical protein